MKNKLMTDKEIIQYWVNNRKEMRAFMVAPEECQSWLCSNPGVFVVNQLNGGGKWVKLGVNQILPHVIYSLSNVEESGFIEFDIDEAGKYELPNGARPWWEDQAIHTQLHDQHGYLFAGWFFENKSSSAWFTQVCGETKSGLLTTFANDWVRPIFPKKIRFYKG